MCFLDFNKNIMILHEKISSDLNKVLSFISEKLISDGEENFPQSLIISFRQVESSRIDSYIYWLPKGYQSDLIRLESFYRQIMKEIADSMPVDRDAKNFHVEYKLTFNNGSSKVISLLDEIEKIAKQSEKLKNILIKEFIQLAEKIDSLRPSFDPKQAYYWQIALETPKIEKQGQRYFFNYCLDDLLSFGEESETCFSLHPLYRRVLWELESFLELLEIRSADSVELKFRIITIQKDQRQLREAGIEPLRRQRRERVDSESAPMAAALRIPLQDDEVSAHTVASQGSLDDLNVSDWRSSTLGLNSSFFGKSARSLSLEDSRGKRLSEDLCVRRSLSV